MESCLGAMGCLEFVLAWEATLRDRYAEYKQKPKLAYGGQRDGVIGG